MNNLVTADDTYTWPIINEEIREAVAEQLTVTTSIYGSDGIFQAFEESWARIHNRAHSLVTSSGTAALHSAFVAIDLRPGDVVAVPSYTFFATVTPLLQLGVRIVTIDSDMTGNPSPDSLRSILDRHSVRAVVITHLWGNPARISELSTLTSTAGVVLIEDCSHAHLAETEHGLVGTFGDIAIWSLQGQKLVTGGEGGVLVCDNDEYYYRALSLGHYNVRCKQEIPPDHELATYAMTGFGLKLRAHPLAIAMAMAQLRTVDSVLSNRRRYAETMLAPLLDTAVVVPATTLPLRSSWYTFTFALNRSHTGLLRDEALEILHSLGVSNAAGPGANVPVASLPIFTSTTNALPGRYLEEALLEDNSDVCTEYFSSMVRFPVWAESDRADVADQYSKGLSALVEVAASRKPR